MHDQPPPGGSPTHSPNANSLSKQDYLTLLALQSLDDIGPRTLFQLLEPLQNPSQFFSLDTDSRILQPLRQPARTSLLNFKRAPTSTRAWAQAERSYEWLLKRGSEIIYLHSLQFPARLLELSDCPPFLVVDGNTQLLSKSCVTIVGTRKLTPLGEHVARQMASELAAAGFVVVSGMAHGIDSAAHRGALEAGGSTIAVWATGLDRVYPSSARQLAGAIRRGGAIVTEMPLGTEPLKGTFIRRNRIVAALSEITVVVEAECKSGSLVTAQLALELNREVAAVPGAVNQSKSAGCHALIKQGAALVEDAADVIALVSGVRSLALDAAPADRLPAGLSEVQKAIVDVFDGEPLPVEILQLRTGLSMEQLNQQLVDMELEGLLVCEAGCYQLLR